MNRLLPQHRDRRQVDEGEEVPRRLLVARGYASKLFDAADESLHQVPLLIQVSVILSLILQVAARRNHRQGGRRSWGTRIRTYRSYFLVALETPCIGIAIV